MSGIIAKPKLRRIFVDTLRKHVIIACGLAVISSYAMKLLYLDPRREKINEFYRNYDPKKEAARFRAMGIYKLNSD